MLILFADYFHRGALYLFYNLLSSIIRALGDSKTPFWFLLFSTILNILLDLFVFWYLIGELRERL